MFSPLHLSPLLLALPLVGAGDAPAEHPFETDAHRVPATEVGAVCLIKGATVHTATRPAFVGDVLVRDGRIVRQEVWNDLAETGIVQTGIQQSAQTSEGTTP